MEPSTDNKSSKKDMKEIKKIEKSSEENNWTYTMVKEIGSGSFGTVYLATIAETGEMVAIKKVFQDKRYKNRELAILKELDHPNLVKTRQNFFTPGEKKDDVYLNVVMDYVPETLSRTIRQYNKSKNTNSYDNCKNIRLSNVKIFTLYSFLRNLSQRY